MSAPALIWNAVTGSAQLSTVLQILLYLPLTLSVLGQPAFLTNSLLLFGHALIHGTMAWFSSDWSLLSVLQPPMHPFLLLLSFNIFSSVSVNPWWTDAAGWWGWILRLSSPVFIIMEGLSSLLVAQKLGQEGKQLIGDRPEEFQFGLLIVTAIAYVASGVWIAQSYSAVATSPLSSTFLGIAITAFVFLTFIGFALRRTNVIESSGLALFLAYNMWLCGFDQQSFSDPASSYRGVPNPLGPLLDNILPYLQILVNFITNTLPRPVIVALCFRLGVLQAASRILPTIGADPWDADDNENDARPTALFTRFLLTYRQAIFVSVYSNLLLLDHSSQVWWRWMNVFFTLTLWGVELLVSAEDDPIQTKWKVE